MKKLIIRIEKCFNNFCNYLTMKRKGVHYDKPLIIRGRIKIYGNGDIIFGKNISINSSLRSNPIGGMEKSIFCVNHPGKLLIEEGCGISNSCIVCNNAITIEKNVKIGGNCKIYDTDFHSLDSIERLDPNDRGTAEPVIIRESAFIGAHSIILKGVCIGKRSIVGAGSVVTKNIADDEVWAGAPARFIRKTHSYGEKNDFDY